MLLCCPLAPQNLLSSHPCPAVSRQDPTTHSHKSMYRSQRDTFSLGVCHGRRTLLKQSKYTQARFLHDSLVRIGLSPKPTRSRSSPTDALYVLCLPLLPQPFSAIMYSECRTAPFRRVVPRLLFNCCSCHLLCDCKTSWFSAFASLRAPSKALLIRWFVLFIPCLL